MDETAARRTTRTPRRGYDIEQTHFFYRDDLEAGATVVDHVTGEAVGEVGEVGRHVFEGYGAPSADGGDPGDLVVHVVALEPAAAPVRAPAAGAAPEADEHDASDEPTVEVPDERVPGDEATVHLELEPEPESDPAPERDRGALGASVAQGVAIAVLAPLLALGLLVLLLVLLVG